MQTENQSSLFHSCKPSSWFRFCLPCVIVAILLAGCNFTDITPGATSSVAATDVTKAMVGPWGSDGEDVVSITLVGDQVVLTAPSNEMWRMDILDATIVDDTIQFVQKNFLRSGESHPFSGMACNGVVKMVSEDEMEYTLTTLEAPDIEPVILTRVE